MHLVKTELIDFKNSIPSSVVLNDDDSYTIFLNSRLNYCTLQSAYLHELRHINNNDFYRTNVNQIENVTHFC